MMVAESAGAPRRHREQRASAARSRALRGSGPAGREKCDRERLSSHLPLQKDGH